MKNNIFYFVCFVSLFLINGCSDPWIGTEIEIKNESVYNLHITFKNIIHNSGFNREIDIKKGETAVFGLSSGQKSEGVKPSNPNNENVKINVFDSDTKKLLKEMYCQDNLFEFIRSDSDTDYYVLKITDILISGQ